MNNRTRIAVERQIAAMGADIFEVGLFKPRGVRDLKVVKWLVSFLVPNIRAYVVR